MCSHGDARSVWSTWSWQQIKTEIAHDAMPSRMRDHNVVQITSGNNHYAVIVDSKLSTIRQSQEASFNNKEQSVVVFMVENEPIYANIKVLSKKSVYFAAIFHCNMRESIERVVTVTECSKAGFLQDDFSVSI